MKINRCIFVRFLEVILSILVDRFTVGSKGEEKLQERSSCLVWAISSIYQDEKDHKKILSVIGGYK